MFSIEAYNDMHIQTIKRCFKKHDINDQITAIKKSCPQSRIKEITILENEIVQINLKGALHYKLLPLYSIRDIKKNCMRELENQKEICYALKLISVDDDDSCETNITIVEIESKLVNERKLFFDATEKILELNSHNDSK